MNVDQYDSLILVPALKIVDMYSLSAHVLMLCTILKESKLEWVEQVGPGTAMGFPQIEEDTHKAVQVYLNRRDNRNIKERVLSACFYQCFPSSDALIHNLRYAVLIARVKYWMITTPLPLWDDAEKLAEYYVKFYNGGGKAKLDESTRLFADIIKNRFKG